MFFQLLIVLQTNREVRPEQESDCLVLWSKAALLDVRVGPSGLQVTIGRREV